MSIASHRIDTIASIASRVPAGSSVNFSTESPATVFGSNTFSLAVMKDTLKPDTYASIVDTIQDGAKLSEKVADEVARP